MLQCSFHVALKLLCCMCHLRAAFGAALVVLVLPSARGAVATTMQLQRQLPAVVETNTLSSPTIASYCDSIASILSTKCFLSGLMATVTALSVQCFCLCVLLSPSQCCCFCSSFCVLAMHPPCRLHGRSTGERVAAHSMIAAECIEGRGDLHRPAGLRQ